MDMKERLVLIDGNSLINRAYYALPLLTNKEGAPSGAVYGFATMLVRMIEEYAPKYIAVAFDMHAKTFRHKMYDGYKATRRGMPDDLVSQMPMLKEMLDVMGIAYFEQEGVEADDIIGTLAKAHMTETLILTGDRDSFQLIDADTTVLFTRRGITDVDVMNESNLFDTMGLTPAQIVDYKALAGDSSDNIPGVAGVGDKTATDLLQKYGDVAGVYAHLDVIGGKTAQKLEAGRESCALSYELAKIKTDCDVHADPTALTYRFPFSADVMAYFEKMEFRSLVRRSALFGEAVEPQTVYRAPEIISLSSVGALTAALASAEEFAVVGGEKISVSADGGTQYDLPLRQTLLDALPSEAEVWEGLCPLLENASVVKYVYDAKKFKKTLAGFGITPAGVEDVALMEYLDAHPSKQTSAEGFATSLGLQTEHAAAALLLGGKDLLKRLGEDGSLLSLYRDLELPLIDVLIDMERTGFLLDRDQLADLKVKYDVAEKESIARIYELAGKEFNVNSPKQLAKVLFEDLGLPYPKRKSSTVSTSAEILAHVANEHPIVPEVMRYRFLSKLNSTYIVGLGRVAGRDGIVHTEFNQMSTATGRLSSSEPNLQNIPVREEEGKALRRLFVAREGNILVSADYSQIELRVMAHLSQDENLIRAYCEGADIHKSVATELFGTPDPTPPMRRVAKTVNFGIIYGMSAFGLSERLGISPKEAKEYISRYFERFPGVKQYLDDVVARAKETGVAESLFGRKRVIPELRSRDYQQRSFGERAAMNMPLQSTAADIIKFAMLRVSRALEGSPAKLILQVHDELIVDTPIGEEAHISELLKREMEAAADLRVPLVAEVHAGKSWAECK